MTSKFCPTPVPNGDKDDKPTSQYGRDDDFGVPGEEKSIDGATPLARGETAHLTQARAAGLSHDDLPPAAVELTRQCVLDYLGVALAGADDPLVRILLDELAAAGGTPQASLVGHPVRLPVLAAALLNGAAAHALDYDDVNLSMPGHPSVAILPGLIALAESERACGRIVADR